ncbi:DUF2194 domain-containing protein [Clostridium algidicarnis]|uniref:DUF2194 domain-containing protein n=1 Tax=Clostridium algidicarnis TaxID=37659 RepID=UPI003FD6CE88
MNNKKIIVTILVGILFLALITKGISSDSILKFVKNINKYDSLEKYEVKNVDTSNLKKEKYILIYDENDEGSIDIKDNVAKTLSYMQKDSVEIEISKLKEVDNSSDGYIVCSELLESISKTNEIISYVKNGGSIFFAKRPLDSEKLMEIKESLGIESIKEFKNAIGIDVISDFMLGAKGYITKEDFINNSSLDVSLKEQSKVHLKDSNGLPLLWEYKLDKGKVVVFNGTMLEEKINRGLIAGALSLMKDNFIYPIVNSKVVFIDDFPSPIPMGKNPLVYNEYKLETDKFYREVWWSDLIKYSKLYNVKYSGFIIETYNNNTKSPFNEEDQFKNKNDLLLYGRELLRNGGEMGIHGYNHQPLVMKDYIKGDLGYNSWDNIEDMKEALNEVSIYTKSIYDEYEIRAYVPPSNILSNEGREAIKSVLPDIKIISSLYFGNEQSDSYIQEFEVAKDGIIEFPRFTSGYEESNELYWSIYNGVNSFGIVSHFVHPDDVLDVERNSGKSWSKLTEEFGNIFKTVKEKYSWMTPRKISDAGEALKNYLDMDVYIKYKDDQMIGYIDNFRKEGYFILRSNGKIGEPKNCEIISLEDEGYIIKALGPEFSIKILR